MAVNETIVTGRYFRRCTDAANKVWQRISFWHKASDCEFDDNKNAQTKVGAIKGITTSTSVTETGYAADMTTVKNLQTQIDELNSNLGNINDYGLPFCIQSISMSHNASSDDTRHTYAPVTITIKWLRDCTVSGVTYSGSTAQHGGGLTLGDINGFHAKDSTTSFTGSVDSAYSAGSCGITYDYSNATITY